ncbi:SGNH/GDSL hydrolase family protein [Demequina rhizosphaerae]|uniref:SGNH/GDSL hydrolase family protein n=1 Tax=Demequina rhizosphaerae TaxID=1638985 RepID=UPI000782816E|nr:SGNH/GDSL hydrolase family protein [Demequina rhizosphaerae]
MAYREQGRVRAWLTREYGGLSMWGLLVVLLVLGGVAGLWAYTKSQAAAEPDGDAFGALVIREAAFVGDSYSAGAGASDTDVRWTTVVANDLGWSEDNVALGGTGYVTSAGKEACGLDYCGTYAETIGDVGGDPDLVVISGGRNDGRSPAGLENAAVNTFEKAHTRFPNALIVATSPLWDDDEAPAWLEDNAEVVKRAAEETGTVYLDIGQPLAGHPAYIAEDGLHPNDAGHVAIAIAFEAAWEDFAASQ